MAGINEIYTVTVADAVSDNISFSVGNGSAHFCKAWCNHYTNWSWGYPVTVYKYQVKCPKKSCQKMNWLELNKITPCTNCESKLKAVTEEVDYEITVE